MNWNDIKEQYPNSYELFINWNCSKSEICPSSECYEIQERDFYDFFDYYDIYLAIHKEDIGSDEWEFSYEIEYLPIEFEKYKRRCSYFKTILSFKEYGHTYIGAWVNRIKAEQEAFTRAFEVLEKNLNDRNNPPKT